ncbi:MAG: elongation factor G, partial [Candidatus Pacebacteria bacterium]|nr:elongation factor G [Candidatus Paceibacterota bacterium]
GTTYHEEDISGELLKQAKAWRAKLVEKSAEQDDGLLEKFLEGEELSKEEILSIIRKATIARRIIPVYCGSAFKNKGIQRLLDGIVNFLPSPEDGLPIIHAKSEEEGDRPASIDAPFSALAFKIVSDKHMGKLSYIRVYSGKAEAGSVVYNSSRGKTQRLGRILRMHANRQEALTDCQCGDIVAVVGLGDTRTGHTLCTKDDPILLESIEFPAPVMSISIKPASNADSEKMMAGLQHLADEDPTFMVSVDDETLETIIAGMGELHLEVLVERLRREYGVQADVGRPEVAYRETVTTAKQGQYKHAKQTGGRGQYGHVHLRITPTDPGHGFSFINEVTGGRIPSEFIPAVEKGIIKAMAKGPFAGYPVVDVTAAVFDGSYHDVDSSEFAFIEAARVCFREIFLKGEPTLLEPVMSVEVTIPEEFMGPATGSVCQRRGRIESMDEQGGMKIVRGMVPLSEMFGYSNTIRTITSGRGSFTMQFERYEAVPFSIAEDIIKKRRDAGLVR